MNTEENKPILPLKCITNCKFHYNVNGFDVTNGKNYIAHWCKVDENKHKEISRMSDIEIEKCIRYSKR